MFPYQLRNVWDRLVFSGAGQSPHVVNTLEEMYEQVSSTPGAIGYTTQDVEGGRNVGLLEIK